MPILVPPPVEKLTIFVLGSVLAVVGGCLAMQGPLFSWPQAKDVAMAAVGVGMATYDGLRRALKARQVKGGDRDPL